MSFFKSKIKNAGKNQEEFIPYFDELFSKLSQFKCYGKHHYIDIIIFALYKSRLCAVSFIWEKRMKEYVKLKIMDAYDCYQYLALGYWMDKNAPSFSNKVDIADNRMKIYEKTFIEFIESPFVMSILSRSFYWALDNGWELDNAGRSTIHPNQNFDFVALKNIGEAEKKYARLYDELELIILNHCQLELPTFIKLLKRVRD